MSASTALRPPDAVMNPRRIAAMASTPLSFPRTAMQELVRMRCQVRKLRFDLDEDGRGEVLYQLECAGWVFHFFLISLKLDEAQKTDRNFAASWDAMGVLCQGEWTPQREALLRREVPRQRAGFADYDTLMYARGNRSARVFDPVVDSLARGEQPDLRVIAPVGYILRTTAFIGNGQLGTRAFAGFEPDHPLRRPYHAQFCSGFMLREFVFDLVDHLARVRSPQAVRLAPAWRRYLGLGNSAATGLTAFAANHPHLMHQWSLANESAIAQVRGEAASPHDPAVSRFEGLLDKAIRHFEEGARPDDGVFLPPQALAADLARARVALSEFRERATVAGQAVAHPWAALFDWASAQLSSDALEVLQAIGVEAYPPVVERFAESFFASERCAVQPAARAADLIELVDRQYRWALEESQRPGGGHYFWYRCASAPRDVRRGPRGGAVELEHETTLDTMRQVRLLREYLAGVDPQEAVADLVCARPDLRQIVARVQSLAGQEYAELHQDFMAAQYAPFASIRFPLTFFGMEKLEAAPPKSVRGVFLQGAPIAEDVAAGRDGDWPFPLIPGGQGPDVELAPLPPAGLGALAPAALAMQAPVPQELRLAPAEFARMVQVALQGHGASLGVAQAAGLLAMNAQCEGEPAAAAVLAECKAGPDGVRAAASLQDTCTVRGSDRVVLRARGGSALLAAVAAGDLTLARAARRTDGRAVGVVEQARDAWLAEGLVLRCAEDGHLALMCWHARSREGAARSGWALAWPQGPGAALLRGALPGPAPAQLALLASGETGSAALPSLQHEDAAAQLAALLIAPRALPPVDRAEGFALWVAPAAAIDAGTLATALQSLSVPVVSCSGPARQQREREWQQQGLLLAAADFDALAQAGRSLLVPQADESRFLPPGFDPLKGF